MSETRVQAATLLCKIFLHYLILLSEWDGMLELWLRILDIMDRLMNSGESNSLVSDPPYINFELLRERLTSTRTKPYRKVSKIFSWLWLMAEF